MYRKQVASAYVFYNGAVSLPILVTKLYIPPPPPKVIRRPRLIEQMNEGLTAGSKLTLVSAPAGFGKTTLVSEWVDNLRLMNDGLRIRATKEKQLVHRQSNLLNQVAWLSLEEEDSEAVRFLIYLITALRAIVPTLGEEALSVLQSSQPPIEPLLTALLNEVSIIPGKVLLVLDDYHMIDNREVDDALGFLLEHLPPQAHIVITTREDPSLPLPRLRARRQLTELRAADLRFTPEEAAEFLNQSMSLNLSVQDVAMLETRTEGWIAGLQLAALSMKGSQDVSSFIQAFAGDNRYIMDYLVEEALQRQPELVRSFLLQTSILDRLHGPLCDAVVGQSGSKERLEALQRGNFFLIPLDDKRQWYRYHHLFADVLRLHLTTEQPDQVPVLHRRASVWYEQNGSMAEAIRHAFAAEDAERAAELIERALPVMRQSRQEVTLLSWFQALPEEVFLNRPVLNVHYVGTLLQNGQLEGVEPRLRDAEQWLDQPAARREQPIFMEEEEFQRLPGSVAMYRAAIALAQGDTADAMRYARRVHDLVRDDDSFMRGAASSLQGLAAWTSGDLEAASQTYAEGMAHLQRVGFISDVIGGSVTLADIRITQGKLREAMRIYEQGLHLATMQSGPILRGAADMHVGMSELSRERNELENAEQHLLKSKALGELNGLPKNPYRWRVAMARIHESRGDLNEALELLDEAEPLYVGDFSPNIRPISALKARVWIAQGRLDKAFDWRREQKLSADDNLSYLREFEHITLARILLAQYKIEHSDRLLHQAIWFLERLLKAADEGGRMGSAIEILILQALANHLKGEMSAALPPLERAQTLAEPEGFVRMFLNEGAAMASLLREAATRRILPIYTGQLLGAFEAEGQSGIGEVSLSPSPASPLIEPLSQRELEILKLFRTEMSGPEIASELVIALSTVRTHTKSIYSKLNVNSRRAAVNRAIELGLI